MDTTLQGFTEKQAVFVAEYAASNNVSRAAAAAGVSRGTAYSWLAKREFMDAIQEWRSRAMVSAWGSLSAGLQDAIDTVREVLTNDNTATNAKLRAAELIINQSRMLTEEQEIIARLDRLEDTLG